MLKKIEEEVERKNELNKLIENRYNLLANVRISLKHFQLLARLLSAGKIAFGNVLSDESPHKPDDDEIDGKNSE